MPLNKRVTTALLLAAGTGTRLRPMTDSAPKCLTMIGEETILGRLVRNLREQGITKLIVVVGYMEESIRYFLRDNAPGLMIEYVVNADYSTTNNIYSLWLARQQIQEPFLLLESDVVFDASMLRGLLKSDKIAISNLQPWMNGTTVTLNNKKIRSFHVGADTGQGQQFKTVNFYSLSLPTWYKVLEGLNRYITDKQLDSYYEAVFVELVANNTISLEAVFFHEDRWYEIDTIEDLHQADKRFGQLAACDPLLDIPTGIVPAHG